LDQLRQLAGFFHVDLLTWAGIVTGCPQERRDRKSRTRGRVGPAGYPAGPPSEPHQPLIAAYGSSKPLGGAGPGCAGSRAAGAVPAPAGGVYQAGVVVVRR